MNVLTNNEKNMSSITFICGLLLVTCLNVAIHYFFANCSFLSTKNQHACIQPNGIVYAKVLPLSFSEPNKQQENHSFIEKQEQILQGSKTNQEESVHFLTKPITSTPVQDEMLNKPTTQREAIAQYQKSNWRIQIPRLNLDAHILEGTDSDILVTAVGHFEETATWNGNVCLIAHNRGYLCNFFARIKELKKGDTIVYLTNKGKRVYQVIVNKVIEETDWTALMPTKENYITLITCEENRRAYRRCIQAVEIRTEENSKTVSR